MPNARAFQVHMRSHDNHQGNVKHIYEYIYMRVRDPMRWMNFLNLPNASGRTRPWGLLSL
jgi:hypothetical protein